MTQTLTYLTDTLYIEFVRSFAIDSIDEAGCLTIQFGCFILTFCY